MGEAYPNLKAYSNFQQLRTALSATKDNLAVARRGFNAMVQGYNSMIQQFPMVLFARTFGFTQHEFFNIGDKRQQLEQVP